MNDRMRLGKTLWAIADGLCGAMRTDELRDYMLSFLFLYYLSDTYQKVAKKELQEEYPVSGDHTVPLQRWYKENQDDIEDFEGMMRRRLYYVIHPDYLWDNIVALASERNDDLLGVLKGSFAYIEEKSFEEALRGIFSEANLDSKKLGENHSDRNERLCSIIIEIANGLDGIDDNTDALGDAYEYLIDQFASSGSRRVGEYYTPWQISTVISEIIALDRHDPASDKRNFPHSIFDFACGSGSLLLNVRRRIADQKVGVVYAQEIGTAEYNLARMNMLLHGVKSEEFRIFRGDTLKNEWSLLREEDPVRKMFFDVVVANPPLTLRRKREEVDSNDVRFIGYDIAPRSVADFAFLLHGLHYLNADGIMAIVLHNGALFRGGVEQHIRKKLVDDGNIDTIIGLPSGLFYSTGSPICIWVLKKRKRADNIMFIDASRHFEKGRHQNSLRQQDIDKIIAAYKSRGEEERYCRPVSIQEIRENDYNMKISRYVSTEEPEPQIDLTEVYSSLVKLDKEIAAATKKHNEYLKQLGLLPLPGPD